MEVPTCWGLLFACVCGIHTELCYCFQCTRWLSLLSVASQVRDDRGVQDPSGEVRCSDDPHRQNNQWADHKRRSRVFVALGREKMGGYKRFHAAPCSDYKWEILLDKRRNIFKHNSLKTVFRLSIAVWQQIALLVFKIRWSLIIQKIHFRPRMTGCMTVSESFITN